MGKYIVTVYNIQNIKKYLCICGIKRETAVSRQVSDKVHPQSPLEGAICGTSGKRETRNGKWELVNERMEWENNIPVFLFFYLDIKEAKDQDCIKKATGTIFILNKINSQAQTVFCS